MDRKTRNLSSISVMKDFVQEKKKPVRKILSKTKQKIENFQTFKRLDGDNNVLEDEDVKENTFIKRRKIQDQFVEDCPNPLSSTIRSNSSSNTSKTSKSNGWFNSTLLSNVSINQFNQTKGKLVKQSKTKLTRSMSNLQTTIGTWKQKLRSSTRRRYQLSESPGCILTPSKITPRRILGRTPTKLYSPFDIETPPSRMSSYTNQNVMTPITEVNMIDEFNLCRITRSGIKQKLDRCLPYHI